MATEVLLPRIGFSMNAGVLAEWLVRDSGQAVECEKLSALESDTSTSEVEGPATGKLRIPRQVQETYQTGTVLAVTA